MYMYLFSVILSTLGTMFTNSYQIFEGSDDVTPSSTDAAQQAVVGLFKFRIKQNSLVPEAWMASL